MSKTENKPWVTGPALIRFIKAWSEAHPDEIFCASPEMWLALFREFRPEIKDAIEPGCGNIDLFGVPVIECRWMKGDKVEVTHKKEWERRKREYDASR